MYRAYFLRGDMIAVMKRNGGVCIAIHYDYDEHNNTCAKTEEFWDISKKEAVKILKKYLDR